MWIKQSTSISVLYTCFIFCYRDFVHQIFSSFVDLKCWHITFSLTCPQCWFWLFFSLSALFFILCVCVGGVWGGWHFFSALLPNSRWCLHVLPLLSSSISSQHVLQHTAASLKRYFTMFSTLIIKGWLQVQTPLETDNHQNSLIFTTVSLKGQICNTQQQICFQVFDKNCFFCSRPSADISTEAERWMLLVLAAFTKTTGGQMNLMKPFSASWQHTAVYQSIPVRGCFHSEVCHITSNTVS